MIWLLQEHLRLKGKCKHVPLGSLGLRASLRVLGAGPKAQSQGDKSG